MDNHAVEVVRGFLEIIRSGADLSQASRFMAPKVQAHQVQSEDPATVERTPEEYAEHVAEMLESYGPFTLRVDELFGSGDRVYARWAQIGTHVGRVGDIPATGAQITELASAVYRVEHGLIVEYWIQADRLGVERQLTAAAVRTPLTT